MSDFKVCEHCKSWVNTERSPHEVLTLKDGRTVYVHYYVCAALFKQEMNGQVEKWVRGEIRYA